ncbi:hypothetical protein [Methylobacterium oryzisoli]|uniref:hypothetical protein n=1 Tax=Methylobacterium oryzisoli TaxID=3385502 RepID=UPI003892B7C7
MALLDAAQTKDREDSLVILARLIVNGEVHRLALIHDLAGLIVDGQNTARAEQALNELDAVLTAMRVPTGIVLNSV